MKLVPVLIAILSFFFATLPCCMEDDPCNELEFEQTSESEHGCNDQFPCSPFFSCGTCIGFSSQAAQIDLKVHIEEFKGVVFPPLTQSLPEQSLNRKTKPPRGTA